MFMQYAPSPKKLGISILNDETVYFTGKEACLETLCMPRSCQVVYGLCLVYQSEGPESCVNPLMALTTGWAPKLVLEAASILMRHLNFLLPHLDCLLKCQTSGTLYIPEDLLYITLLVIELPPSHQALLYSSFQKQGAAFMEVGEGK